MPSKSLYLLLEILIICSSYVTPASGSGDEKLFINTESGNKDLKTMIVCVLVLEMSNSRILWISDDAQKEVDQTDKSLFSLLISWSRV